MAIILWDETAPAGASKIRLGDNEMRNFKEQVRRRMRQAGQVWNQATLPDEGKHAVGAGESGESPDIYQSDNTTKIIAWADASCDLLADYKFQGAGAAVTKNMTESVMDDGIITLAATTGYARTMTNLQITESSPADGLINVAAGQYATSGGANFPLHAGGTLTVGAGDLTVPTAGQEVAALIYITDGGVLTGLKGAEIGEGSGPVAPPLPVGGTAIGVIFMFDDSVNFSLLTSGRNSYLLNDYRMMAPSRLAVIQQIGRSAASTGSGASVVIASKTITTAGGIVMVQGAIHHTTGATFNNFEIGRSGAGIAGATVPPGSFGTIIGFEQIAGGTYTYELRRETTAVATGSIVVAELGLTTFF